MQIELLDTFLDLMETGSFNRTAERLGIKQSTVSNRVNALESAIGARLFDRSRAGTRPTVAGQRLYNHALSLRHEWNEAQRRVQGAGDFTQSMRVGIQHDLGDAHIGEWTARFRSILPETAFYVELDYSGQMSNDLLSGQLDFAVMFTPKNIPDLHYEQIGATVYQMISSEASVLAEIKDNRYVFANYSPAFYKMHSSVMQNPAAAPLASGQNTAVRSLLNELGGSAYVLSEDASEMVASGRFRHVDDAPPIRQAVYAAMHLRHRRSRSHVKLVEATRQLLAQQMIDIEREDLPIPG